MGSMPDSIPTIDITPFIDNEASPEAQRVVDAVRYACTTYGFFYLNGHGIKDEERQKILACAR